MTTVGGAGGLAEPAQLCLSRNREISAIAVTETGTSMTKVAGSRETVQSEMCRSPFPVPNGKHSPGSPTKDVRGSAQSPQRSLFTPDTCVKLN
ncbi:hypothetical protein EYF80_024368 [Liparis tanakae]|uniref:Uncharacterized protein n=1 Tax=Liparis tanakae TaxID=230148 RepID=A0A4Z2HHW5_9TELE|nr:hypothetical protein EYF80_024368 [Liparis tanakae]